MQKNDISKTLRDYIRQRFQVPEGDPEFNDDVDLFNYGYIDSFGAVDMSNFIENNFSIKLSDTDWITIPMNTINDITSFVLKRKNNLI